MEKIIQSIMKQLMSFSNFYEQESQKQLNPTHLEKIKAYISKKQKIFLVLPAFPAKSSNPLKTYSRTPDFGELKALFRLNSLGAKIKKMYPPGAEIVVCSDGRVFSDLVGVKEADVSLYGEKLKTMKEEFKLDHLSFFNLEDVYSNKRTFEEMRTTLEEKHAQPLDSLQKLVKEKKEEKQLFNGIHRFIKEDFFILNPQTSRNQVCKQSKETAYKVIQRSNAWSSLLKSFFPQAVRLSIHPQEKNSSKFPVKLIPGLGKWGTPWHGVLLKKGKKFELVKYKQAKEIGAVQKHFSNSYVYFETKEAL